MPHRQWWPEAAEAEVLENAVEVPQSPAAASSSSVGLGDSTPAAQQPAGQPSAASEAPGEDLSWGSALLGTVKLAGAAAVHAGADAVQASADAMCSLLPGMASSGSSLVPAEVPKPVGPHRTAARDLTQVKRSTSAGQRQPASAAKGPGAGEEGMPAASAKQQVAAGSSQARSDKPASAAAGDAASIRSLLQDSCQALNKWKQPLTIHYVGLFLDPLSHARVLSLAPPIFSSLSADHTTLVSPPVFSLISSDCKIVHICCCGQCSARSTAAVPGVLAGHGLCCLAR